MDAFTDIETRPAERRDAEHGGVGPISFRRLMNESQFASAMEFVDFTVIPSGSSIGRHCHVGSEEFYFVVHGTPLINVNGCASRAAPGTLAMVRSGEWHSLDNDTLSDVTILVVQARVSSA